MGMYKKDNQADQNIRTEGYRNRKYGDKEMEAKREMFQPNLFCETKNGPRLIALQCRDCGSIQFPQKGCCKNCSSRDLKEVEIGERGTLYSFTTNYGKLGRWKAPFTNGWIDLPEGVRLFAPLRQEEQEELAIGKEVELEIADLWTEEDGTIKTGYRYHLVK